MQGVLACIDANGVSDCSGCLIGHGDVLLVLPKPPSKAVGVGVWLVHPFSGIKQLDKDLRLEEISPFQNVGLDR